MEFQLEEDFVKENELNENQVKAITSRANDYLAERAKEWDGRANDNAEGILTGVAKSVLKNNNLEIEREKGEKWNDYLNRLSDAKFANEKQSIEDRQKELEDKLKNFKGSDDLKKALEEEQLKNDALLQQVAELEPLKGLDDKYKTATEELSGLKLSVAFTNVKPSFPEEVNKYEAKAKWDEFKNGVLDKHNIELNENNEAIAVDKENPHKKVKLSELVEKDEKINELLKGRQQRGTGADPKNLKDVEGVPFKVPEKATGEERSKAIKEYLQSQNIPVTSNEYAKKFSEFNLKIAQAKKSA